MGFPRKEYCRGVPFPFLGDLQHPGIKPACIVGSFFTLIYLDIALICNFYYIFYIIRFITFSTVAQSCPTLCNPMNHSTPGLAVHHQLPESTQTHVLCVGDAIQPSHPVVPFSSCPQSFPASGSFQMSQLFASDGQSIGVSVSTSILPMNTQD